MFVVKPQSCCILVFGGIFALPSSRPIPLIRDMRRNLPIVKEIFWIDAWCCDTLELGFVCGQLRWCFSSLLLKEDIAEALRENPFCSFHEPVLKQVGNINQSIILKERLFKPECLEAP